MSVTAGEARTELLSRIRKPGTIAYSEAAIYDILSKCQQVVNHWIGRLTATGTVTTAAYTYFYDMQTELPSAMYITKMTESNRQIARLKDWRELSQYSRSWLSDTGTRFEAYTQIGVDLLVIYPAKAAGSSVAVTYVKIPTTLSASGTAFDLPDNDVDTVIDLAEIVLLISARNFIDAKRRIGQMGETVKDLIRWQ